MKRKLPLLVKVIIGMILGVVYSYVMPSDGIRLTNTFSAIFSELLKFIVPLIIFGLVTPAILDSGKGAARMLLTTVLIAYASTIFAGAFAYGCGATLFPHIISNLPPTVSDGGRNLAPFFTISIPPMFDVTSALAASFIFGLAMVATGSRALKYAFHETREVIIKTLDTLIIPLLPLYIFTIFANMAEEGKVGPIIIVFAKIIGIIFLMTAILLIIQYSIAGLITRRNPFKALVKMLPAYLTALGTSSSAATIPVTLRQAVAMGVSEETAGFTVPLCATVHLAGSTLKITSCAIALVLVSGGLPDPAKFTGFIFMLGVVMIAAPGVPGGAIMSALGVLSSILGFTPEMNAMMITLYIAMDSFGTACNVTGDGAIALIVDHLAHQRQGH